jgi:hypothetical protein
VTPNNAQYAKENGMKVDGEQKAGNQMRVQQEEVR